MKINIHGIPYVATFIVLQNNVVDSSYSMLLKRPWHRDAKVTHGWGNNVITIQNNGIIRTTLINKKLGVAIRRPQVLVCYGLLEGLTNEEEDLIFETKPKLFSIGTITISKEKNSLLSITLLNIIINEESKPQQWTLGQRTTKVVSSTIKPKDFYVKPKISFEDKIYP
jgi:hypothetical protein